MDADGNCLDVKTPKFLLQPLVENSILHNKILPNQYLNISISVRELDGMLKIIVQDDGAGIDPETLDQLRNGLASTDFPRGRNGFRLNNVNRRIKLFYGPEYGLQIESVMGCTQNIIELPVEMPCDT